MYEYSTYAIRSNRLEGRRAVEELDVFVHNASYVLEPVELNISILVEETKKLRNVFEGVLTSSTVITVLTGEEWVPEVSSRIDLSRCGVEGTSGLRTEAVEATGTSTNIDRKDISVPFKVSI